MSGTDDRKAELEAQREADEAAHKVALEVAAKQAEAEAEQQHGAGYDDTLPGQTEIVAGSPEHEALLRANPNASSYGPEVNVVVAPVPVEPEPEPEPEAQPEEDTDRYGRN